MTAMARDSPEIRVSWPGTNRLAQRAGGVWPQPVMRSGQQRARGPAPRHRGTADQAAAVLHHGDHRQCRFRALVAIAAGGAEAVAAAAGPLVEQRNLGIVVAEEPRHAHARRRPASCVSPVTAAARTHASASAATSIGCWSKPGRGSPGPQPPTGTTDRWPSRVSPASSHSSMRRPLRRTGSRPSSQPATMTASAMAAFA